jgi:hypothetical protein
MVTCANTNELLAIKLRPGNAGANTAADHLTVLVDAIAQIPAAHRRHLLIRGDSAAGTHAVLDWLTVQNTRRHTVEYSIGWSVAGRTRRHHHPARHRVDAGVGRRRRRSKNDLTRRPS